MHGAPIQHTGEPHGKIRHVDHLLHFAVPFGFDLAHFQRHQSTQRVFVLPQRLPDQTNDFASLGGRHLAPRELSFTQPIDEALVIVVGTTVHTTQYPAIRWIS